MSTTYTHTTQTGHTRQRNSVGTFTHVTVVIENGEHHVATWHASAEAALKIVNGNCKVARALKHQGVYMEAINDGAVSEVAA